MRKSLRKLKEVSSLVKCCRDLIFHTHTENDLVWHLLLLQALVKFHLIAGHHVPQLED